MRYLEIQNADDLLHIEGFSENYFKDCRFAFSTKISDYLMVGKPFILYGPTEISGEKFYSKLQTHWCITSKEELKRLPHLIKKLVSNHVT